MENLRYLNKQTNQVERQNFSNWLKEQITVNGQEILYYTNQSALSAANPLYGEQFMAGFGRPKRMIFLFVLNNDVIMLSKYGIIADGDLNGIIHPDHFSQSFGVGAEPRPGDLIRLEEYGIDRINHPKRGPNVFEITETIDEFQLNPLGGHYVWFFKAKRYDYSHEPNSPGPGVGNTTGSGTECPELNTTENFDYIFDNPKSNTSVYGQY